MQLSQTLQLIVSGLVTGSIYALVALGFSIIFSTSKVINFAQGSFVVMGTLFSYLLLTVLGLPILLALPIAMACVAVLGLLTERIAVRPSLRVGGLGWFLSTLGVAIVLENAQVVTTGGAPRPFPSLFGQDVIKLLGVSVTREEIFIFVIAVALLLAVDALQNGTLTGKAMKAVAWNPRSAALVGIDSRRMIVLSFMAGAIVGAVGGILIAPITFVNPNLGLPLAIKGFVAAVIGGLGHSRGALVGGLALGVLENLSIAFLGPGLQDVVSFVVLVAILLFLPAGIFGKQEVVKV